jgi:hypothetical protein
MKDLNYAKGLMLDTKTLQKNLYTDKQFYCEISFFFFDNFYHNQSNKCLISNVTIY